MVDLGITENDFHTEWYLTGRKNQLLKELPECVGDKEILVVARELKKVISELQTKYGESEEKKYKYAVSLTAGGRSEGYVNLTKREAEIVSYATDERNWEDKELNPYSSSFYIDLEYPVETEYLKKELEYVENFFGELTDSEFMQMYDECANSNSEIDKSPCSTKIR